MLRLVYKYNPRAYLSIMRVKNFLSYKPIPNIGKNCKIHPHAEFIGDMNGVLLDDNVRVDAHAQIYNTHGSTIKIGKNSTITSYAFVKNASKNASIEIGSDCTLQHFSIIYGAGPVKIGNFVRIASHSSIIPVNKTFEDPDMPIHHQGLSETGIILEDDIWIGSGVRILDGVHIGHGSIVAAGAVVNRSFDAFSVIGGVPAKLLRRRKKEN